MLYICATPIGNLKDITLRVLEVLEAVDEIACEDTRTSGKLLSHYGIKKPLYSYHEHNERLVTQPFYFHGFLDRKQIAKQLATLANLAVTLVFYESPHRLLKTLQQMLSAFGNRQITLARELTKLHEQYQHLDIASAIEYYTDRSPKGEFVLVVAGAQQEAEALSIEAVVALAERRIAAGERHKDVVKELAKAHRIDRQALYRATLNSQ